MKSYNDPIENFKLSMEVNATGVFYLTRLVARNMIKRKKGSIINISSYMGIIGPDFGLYEYTDMKAMPDYFFHKGGMANLTRFLASYYGPRGIRVNCVHPGGLQADSHPEAFVRNYSERTCLGRLARDSDLMGIIVFLASDASLYVTGTNIPVDGGYTAK